jgi:hypothetical protein
MKKFQSIEQFRNIVKTVRTNHDYKGKDENGDSIYNHDSNYPVLTFQGTVKLHGTNASVIFYKDKMEFQSRERVLSITQDNAGFMFNYVNYDWTNILKLINTEFTEYIGIYGEWCGEGIQKGVAISELPKMFVIFGISVDNVWIDLDHSIRDKENRIFNITQFPTYTIDIDFNNPELSQNRLIKMTEEVEKECPVGKYFGISGIGEGIVFSCISDQTLRFKSKGEKHSVSKVKVLNSVDEEKVNSINEFVDNVVTENRLLQGISYFKENNIAIENSNTGDFIRWVIGDIVKEELDTMKANNIDIKSVNGKIANKARLFFLNYI